MDKLIEEKLSELYQLREENTYLKALLDQHAKGDNTIWSKELTYLKKALNATQILGRTGFWEFNLKTKKLTFSRESLELIGLNKTETGHYSLDDIKNIIHSEDKNKLTKFFSNVLSSHNFTEINLRVIKENDTGTKETRHFKVIASIKENYNVFGIFKDITEQQKAIRDISRSKEKIEESDKLKSIFLANMSHEIRTPMNAIIGYTELLSIGGQTEEKRKEYTSIIKKKGSSLLTLIDDIIEISKFESGQINILKSEFNLNQLMNELYNQYVRKKTELNKEHVQLHLHNDPTEHTLLYTDPGRLQQILSHLLNATIKNTEKGIIEFGFNFTDDKKILFHVFDSGMEIPKEKQKNIFSRYKHLEETIFKTHSDSGLSLTIAKGIADILGGKMWLESETNQGCKFFFTIPVDDSDNDENINADEKKVTEPSEYNWKNKVIVIAEDEEINYKFLETILQETQAQVLHAENGVQAIDLVKSINKIDLILMDIKMPEMNGYDATKAIKKLNPNIPIIAQTAFSMRNEKIKCIQAGCDDYISKPIEIETLINKINKVFTDY